MAYPRLFQMSNFDIDKKGHVDGLLLYKQTQDKLEVSAHAAGLNTGNNSIDLSFTASSERTSCLLTMIDTITNTQLPFLFRVCYFFLKEFDTTHLSLANYE